MKYLKYILVYFSCTCSLVLHAQETYLWTGIQEGFDIVRYEMHILDFLNATSNGLLFSIEVDRFTHPNMTGFQNRIRSFEFTGDRSQVYIMEEEGDLYRYTVATDELIYLGDMTPATEPFLIVHGYTQINAITFVNDTILYCAGFTYGEYNITTGLFSEIRSPENNTIASTQIEQEIDCTKLTKHKNEYIYISGPGAESIMRMNLKAPENNEKLWDYSGMPNVGISHKSIVSYQYDCDSTDLFIFGRFSGINGPIGYHKFDLATGVATYSHELPTMFSAAGALFPAVKHYNNPTWEECQRKIDLDHDNSTVEGVSFLLDSLCGFDHVPLSDFDIEISNEVMLDSITIDIMQPNTDVLINIDIGNYILNNGINKINIENNGSSTLEDFEIAIRNGYLANLGEHQEIILSFTAWYGGLPGESAIATLKFATPLPVSGDDIERVFCEGDPVLNIDNMIAPNADLGGLFYNDDFQQITALPDYQAPVSDTIYYITTNDVCYDTARIVNTINPNPEILSVGDFTFCPDESVTIDLSNYIEQIEWSDGSLDVIRIIEDEGMYMYELSNEYGCSTMDTFIIEELPAAETKPIEAKVCEDEVFTFNNVDYEVAGLYSDTIVNDLGCDSVIYNIDFDFYDDVPLELMGDFGLCDDEPTVLTVTSNHDNITLDEVGISNESILIEEPGTYQIAGYDEHGCYYEESIEIVAYGSPMIWTEDLLDTIFSTDLALPVSYEGAIISYSWMPSFGLDCNDCAIPKLLTDENSSYTIEVTDENGCKTEGNIEVSFKSSEVYLPTVIANNPIIPQNGTLYLSGNQIGIYTMQVYDRWGNLLFDRDNLPINESTQGWIPAGKYASGVYVYVIKYEEKGEEKILVGDITLL